MWQGGEEFVHELETGKFTSVRDVKCEVQELLGLESPIMELCEAGARSPQETVAHSIVWYPDSLARLVQYHRAAQSQCKSPYLGCRAGAPGYSSADAE